MTLPDKFKILTMERLIGSITKDELNEFKRELVEVQKNIPDDMKIKLGNAVIKFIHTAKFTSIETASESFSKALL